MPQRPLDGGDMAALLCAFYPGITPWNLNELEQEQRDLFISKISLVRFYHDLPSLTAQFAKIDDEGIENILSPKPSDGKAARRAAAWEIYALTPYGMLIEDAKATEASAAPLLTLSPEAAEGVVRWWESGDLNRLPDGPVIWQWYLLPLHRQIMATAAQLKKT